MLTKELLYKYLEAAGISLNGDRPFDVRVHDERLYKRLRFEPSLGAGESYMEGWWDCDELDVLFFRICRLHLDAKIYSAWHRFFYSLLYSLVNFQTRIRSKAVAEQHYNLGNDFYRDMLGASMAYTCGYWRQAANLDEAQRNKFDLICRKINLKPKERVLDLGCGWGSLAKYMAEAYECEVVAVNISTEQVQFAKEINRGLPVDVYLCDYRDAHIYNPNSKPFDKIVSVGLCEHVGHKNYRSFMQIASANLKETGLFLLHTIGKNDSFPYIDPWTNKYVFPNGILPSIQLLAQAAENIFVIEDLHNFGNDYDKTLMAWHRNFLEHWPKYSAQYGDRFFRMWTYYLLSCAGAFRARGMQLWQFVLSPKGVLGGYESQR